MLTLHLTFDDENFWLSQQSKPLVCDRKVWSLALRSMVAATGGTLLLCGTQEYVRVRKHPDHGGTPMSRSRLSFTSR